MQPRHITLQQMEVDNGPLGRRVFFYQEGVVHFHDSCREGISQMVESPFMASTSFDGDGTSAHPLVDS